MALLATIEVKGFELVDCYIKNTKLNISKFNKASPVEQIQAGYRVSATFGIFKSEELSKTSEPIETLYVNYSTENVSEASYEGAFAKLKEIYNGVDC